MFDEFQIQYECLIITERRGGGGIKITSIPNFNSLASSFATSQVTNVFGDGFLVIIVSHP